MGAGVFDCCDGNFHTHDHRDTGNCDLGNITFLQLVFGYIVGRILITIIFLPGYFRGEYLTAYALIEKRFGSRMRSVAGVTFLATRTLAEGVRVSAIASRKMPW